MDCCSPDVGDCQKCHPEFWIQKGGSYCNWIPKGAIGKAIPIDPKSETPGNLIKQGKRGLAPFNRTRSKHVRRMAQTRKKRIV